MEREIARLFLNKLIILCYVGLPDEPSPHNALTGAVVEAEALSRLLYDKPLLPEFKHLVIPWMR